MKVLLSILVLSLCGTLTRSSGNYEDLQLPWEVLNGKCDYSKDVMLRYRTAIYAFTIKLYKQIALGSGNHFVFSPLSIWLQLAAFAEGTVGNTRQELFKLLDLPQDKCVRQQYYIIATRSEYPGNDVMLTRMRVVVFDEDVIINKRIENFSVASWLTMASKVPLKRDPQWTLDLIRRLFSMKLSNLDVSGNSFILDTMDYNSLWSTAFTGAVEERAPFHNDFGEAIGSVNMLRLRKHLRLAFLTEIQVKYLELPVGYNNRYRMIFAVAVGNNSLEKGISLMKNDVIFNILDRMKISKIPMDVSIPQFTATSEIDMRGILEQFGIKSLWTDPEATRNISTPPALPSGFVHRVTATMERPRLIPFSNESDLKARDLIYEDTGLDEDIGRDFIVNRPFAVIMVDSLTKSLLMASAFSTPPPQFYKK